MTTSLVRETMNLMSSAGIDPIDLFWFDLSGAFTDTQRVTLDPVMTHRPPFEKCMVVWRGHTKHHGSYEVLLMVAGNDPQDGIVLTMWKGPSGTVLQPFPAMVYLIEDDNIRYGSLNEDQPIDKEIAELMLAQVGAWYAAIDKCCESYVPAVRDTFTNRRKITAGKKPSYEWKTVFIEPKQFRQEPKGGTHASPRLHDRRGHLRRLKSGKNVWVKAHKVGDATKGVVFHDYEIKGAI